MSKDSVLHFTNSFPWAGFCRKKFKPVLKFNQNGKFKIVQFTDIHFQYDSYRSDSAST